MVIHVKLKQIPHGCGNLLDAWVTEFQNFITLLANEVVMLPVTVGLLIETGILTELMSFNQT
jgi:hypothetical protein